MPQFHLNLFSLSLNDYYEASSSDSLFSSLPFCTLQLRPLIFFLLFNGRRPTEAFEPADWELAVALAAPVKAAFIADSLRPVEIDTVSGYDSAGRR